MLQKLKSSLYWSFISHFLPNFRVLVHQNMEEMCAREGTRLASLTEEDTDVLEWIGNALSDDYFVRTFYFLISHCGHAWMIFPKSIWRPFFLINRTVHSQYRPEHHMTEVYFNFTETLHRAEGDARSLHKSVFPIKLLPPHSTCQPFILGQHQGMFVHLHPESAW